MMNQKNHQNVWIGLQGVIFRLTSFSTTQTLPEKNTTIKTETFLPKLYIRINTHLEDFRDLYTMPGGGDKSGGGAGGPKPKFADHEKVKLLSNFSSLYLQINSHSFNFTEV